MEDPRHIDHEETVCDVDLDELQQDQVVLKSEMNKDKADIRKEPVDDDD